MSKDSRTMSTHIDHARYNLTAEKTSLLPNQPCEFTCGRIQGFHGPGLSNHQGGEDDVPISFGVDHENSCSRSIAHRSNPKSTESFLEVSATLLGNRNMSGVQDVKRVAMGLAGDDNIRFKECSPRSPESFLEVPQPKKMRKTESHCPFESNSIPLWGFTSICGRRIQMEDAVMAIPRFLQVPPQMLNVESVSNQTNCNISNLTADFYGVYDGHGGCQVASIILFYTKSICQVSLILNISFA